MIFFSVIANKNAKIIICHGLPFTSIEVYRAIVYMCCKPGNVKSMSKQIRWPVKS